MRTFVLMALTLCLSLYTLAQGQKTIRVIQPTGEKVNDLPEMILLPDSNQWVQKLNDLSGRSFVRTAIRLHDMAQCYLINLGVQKEMDEAYLAITPNQGGFARTGFTIKHADGSHTDKPNSNYVDVTADYVNTPPGRLMSITQLYPHELGHILYRLMSATDSLEQQSHSLTIHYFSLLTDHSTAFNEGFAEHIENIARLYEPDDSIRTGIQDDIESRAPFLRKSAQRFIRDYTLPFRLDYYKATMLAWFQQYEDYKRYQHAVDGTVAFKNGYPTLDNVTDMITIRNAGVNQLPVRRNLAEVYASEGMVSAFFTKMALSGAGKVYADPSFYKPFLTDTTLASRSVPFTEVENLFAKYFHVLHNYVTFEHSVRAQLHDFIAGYIKEFPAESQQVHAIFQELTGVAFTSALPPSLWYMSLTHQHRILALDALGAITVPAYTFDINAADDIDLLTIQGVSTSDAALIVHHRNEKGFFRDYAQAEAVPGLSPEAKQALASAHFDESVLEGLVSEDLDIAPLLRAPLLHLLLKATLWFLPMALIVYLSVVRKRDLRWLRMVGVTVGYFFLWILLALAGAMISMVNGNTWMMFAILAMLYLMIGYLILRKRPERLSTFLVSLVLMLAVVGYSLG